VIEHLKLAFDISLTILSGLAYWGCVEKLKACIKERQATAEIKRELFQALLKDLSGKANGQAV
jgi:hypothetical protein